MTTKGIVLEMTDPSQLIPSQVQPDVGLIEVAASDGARIGALYRRIWEPMGGGGRSAWTDGQWVAELGQSGAGAWVARLRGEDVGMAELGWSGNGDAAFIVIGVVPAVQGRGIGGDLLTRLTRLMWLTPADSGQPTKRVWLWTVPDEHVHAVPNYLARGFTRGPDLD